VSTDRDLDLDFQCILLTTYTLNFWYAQNNVKFSANQSKPYAKVLPHPNQKTTPTSPVPSHTLVHSYSLAPLAHSPHQLHALPQSVQYTVAAPAKVTQPGYTAARYSANEPRAHRSQEAGTVAVKSVTGLRVCRWQEVRIGPAVQVVRELRARRLREAGIVRFGAWAARWPCRVARMRVPG
jgi:hypothetical protein